LLVAILIFGHISYQNYMGEAHWLLWLLGPATIAFAVPVYDNLNVIKRHWMSLSAGVITATVVAVTSSVWLARLFTLSDEIQRSLAVRSITTPFALAAAKPLGGQPELVALFLVWQWATCCFCASPFVKEWQKEPVLARLLTAQVLHVPTNSARKKAWSQAW
jgi:putative effector of murein hydrolase